MHPDARRPSRPPHELVQLVAPRLDALAGLEPGAEERSAPVDGDRERRTPRLGGLRGRHRDAVGTQPEPAEETRRGHGVDDDVQLPLDERAHGASRPQIARESVLARRAVDERGPDPRRVGRGDAGRASAVRPRLEGLRPAVVRRAQPSVDRRAAEAVAAHHVARPLSLRDALDRALSDRGSRRLVETSTVDGSRTRTVGGAHHEHVRRREPASIASPPRYLRRPRIMPNGPGSGLLHGLGRGASPPALARPPRRGKVGAGRAISPATPDDANPAPPLLPPHRRARGAPRERDARRRADHSGPALLSARGGVREGALERLGLDRGRSDERDRPRRVRRAPHRVAAPVASRAHDHAPRRRRRRRRGPRAARLPGVRPRLVLPALPRRRPLRARGRRLRVRVELAPRAPPGAARAAAHVDRERRGDRADPAPLADAQGRPQLGADRGAGGVPAVRRGRRVPARPGKRARARRGAARRVPEPVLRALPRHEGAARSRDRVADRARAREDPQPTRLRLDVEGRPVLGEGMRVREAAAEGARVLLRADARAEGDQRRDPGGRHARGPRHGDVDPLRLRARDARAARGHAPARARGEDPRPSGDRHRDATPHGRAEGTRAVGGAARGARAVAATRRSTADTLRSVRSILLSVLAALALVACRREAGAPPEASAVTPPAAHAPSTTKLATFGAGCFWCVEAVFTRVEGVVSATSGYAGGATKNPTYAEVSEGDTGHAEAVQIAYDPSKVTYESLLEIFWK